MPGLENKEVPDGDIHQNPSPAIPKPVFVRLLILFGGGAGCLLVGIIVALATGDLVLLAMSAILGIAFVTKGALLKRKISVGQIFSVSGVCISLAPKILGRYRRVELVDTANGEGVHFILPKKTVFKIGHVYTCYFDNEISKRHLSIGEQTPQGVDGPIVVNKPEGSFVSSDIDLPTNGFLGFEDFGVYQEKPVLTAVAADKT